MTTAANTTDINNLAVAIEAAFAEPASSLGEPARALYAKLVELLRQGVLRAAEPRGDEWVVNAWVKKGILVGMRAGVLVEMPSSLPMQPYIEKNTMAPRPVSLSDGVRIVPGGVSVRDGAFLARGVVLMPPSYVNVGAYLDEGTMLDSNALAGSCAQIGKRVHASAGAQIGGVLEPPNAAPVIIEDDAMIGGNTGVYEGTRVRKRAVIGAGVVLTASTKVYDLVKDEIYEAKDGKPLTIPEGAVVVPGVRAAKGSFAAQHGLGISTPLVVKYRDDKTDARTALEMALRPT